ncbi:MAG TPA: tetratricopeptide repeat protein [Candidatus Methylacidiphilales bacterium]|nr:tetratricopeptide repeat protein [Candidatus Methylacidiphilales bacterium]
MTKRFTKKKAAGRKVSMPETGEAPPASPLGPWLNRDWLEGLVLILAVIVTYTPVWRAGFIWDDNAFLTGNRCIVGPLGLKEIWTTSAADICPLALTTVWFEHALWGLAPLPYHLVNVFLHAACAVLLWRVLASLRAPAPCAWLGAALWALHPVQAESVVWITEIKNTQSGLFYLLSILFFVKWLKTGNFNHESVTGGGWNYGLTLLFTALAMASKSSTNILPVVLCLCAWWVEGRWQWHNLVRTAPIFVLAIVVGVISLWTQGLRLEGDVGAHLTRSWPERIAGAGCVIWFYLGKLAWPYPLMPIYPLRQIDAGQWISYLPLMAALGIVCLLWCKRQAWVRPLFFTFAYFIAALVPVLGFVNIGFFSYSLVADHFQYLASMGPLTLAGTGLIRFSEWIIPEKRGMRFIICAGLLLILGLLSRQRASVYQNEETLWSDLLSKNLDCWVGHNNLGRALAQKGQTKEAIAQYQQALEINPDYAQARNNLGSIFAQEGRVDEALAQFQRALEINPNYAEAQNNMGNVLARKGQVDAAIAHYEQALQIDPYFIGARDNLGLALSQKGKVDQAMIEYQQALQMNPHVAESHYELGNAYLQKGRLDEAIEQYQKALEIDPGGAEVHINLGAAFLQKGQVDEAIVQYQEALEIVPNSAEVHNNLGWAWMQKGEIMEAIAQFQEALRLKPDYAQARSDLVKAQTLLLQKAHGE